MANDKNNDSNNPLSSLWDTVRDDLQMRWRIYQESSQAGYDFKQSLANVLAGEYDQDAVREQMQSHINSAPCVMFTWERSPSCVKAVNALVNLAGAKVEIVRLDDPWSKGNPLRAELGKAYGKCSVPAIFIGGDYVGGFDAGVSDKAPGIQALAFSGQLQAKLQTAGAIEKEGVFQ